jgi:hypothetical protein
LSSLVGHRYFYYLLGVANIGPHHSCRMQGFPPEEPKEYTPFLPNSPEGPSLEGSVNNNTSSDIRISTPLVEPSLTINPLLNTQQDPVLLRINSSGDVVVEYYPRIPPGTFVESSMDEPPFPSEAFRTPVQTSGIFNPRLVPVCSLWRNASRCDIFDKLGMIPNQPTSPHVIFTSTAYIIPINHFAGTTSNIVTVSDPLLVGTHTILPLQLTSSTTVPQVAPFSARILVTIQAPIGTPLPSRSNPSLPPRYNALIISITNPTQGPSREPSLFFRPGYNVVSDFISTPT